MPVFMSARCSIRGGQAIQQVGLLKAETLEGAKKTAHEKTNQEFPTTDGWVHALATTEISKETLQKMILEAR